ncbi:hypothetical protein C500_00547 [Natrialba magadii ATCC 43099]|uniref:Peroxiredoxin family protein n=1 Tax=Natrialba magadii (strain ATCC 43099 / DSM 3394 / CCM 3739 / CIP 104546 / IAM 13178 / JCM 8861 / NBRC 102185 / NCIMB 2190 / MS3) TaxID=547559 RepID=L9VDE3_NATMM|nr:DsrE/DsrF/DrsH-like family protein [Natrialba magadii]ELY34378.1 hypothetical protein C500_00547 [Natrialba magadii ATCC 43099]
MSSDTPTATDGTAETEAATGSDTDSAPGDGSPSDAELLARIDELESKVATLETEVNEDQKKMTIVATQGSFDMAYPPLILASTAAAFGWEVIVFHTFWGLDILHEENSRDLKLSAVGNPNMPMPNALAALPGMDAMAKIDENGTATIEELIDLSLESGVDLQACQMTIELMDYDEDDFYDGVTTGVGAATAIQHMAESDVQLLV